MSRLATLSSQTCPERTQPLAFNLRPEQALKPGDRVSCIEDGQVGTVLTLRPADKKIIVRLDGLDRKLAVLPRAALAKQEPNQAGEDENGTKPKRKGIA